MDRDKLGPYIELLGSDDPRERLIAWSFLFNAWRDQSYAFFVYGGHSSGQPPTIDHDVAEKLLDDLYSKFEVLLKDKSLPELNTQKFGSYLKKALNSVLIDYWRGNGSVKNPFTGYDTVEEIVAQAPLWPIIGGQHLVEEELVAMDQASINEAIRLQVSRMGRRLRDLIMHIPDLKQAQVAILHFLEELTIPEIMLLLKRPRSTVNYQLNKAKTFIKGEAQRGALLADIPQASENIRRLGSHGYVGIRMPMDWPENILPETERDIFGHLQVKNRAQLTEHFQPLLILLDNGKSMERKFSAFQRTPLNEGVVGGNKLSYLFGDLYIKKEKKNGGSQHWLYVEEISQFDGQVSQIHSNPTGIDSITLDYRSDPPLRMRKLGEEAFNPGIARFRFEIG